MALGKKCGGSCLKSKRGGLAAEEGLGLGFVRYTRALGRKRILISSNGGEDSSSPTDNLSPKTPLKKQRSGRMIWGSENSSPLEGLPQEILIKILCGVDHEDLKQLFHVSKVIREATLIAKHWHFAYSTPSKVPAFRTSINFLDIDTDETEAPNAPRQTRLHRAMPSRKKLEEISVDLFDLFASVDEQQGPKKGLFMEADI